MSKTNNKLANRVLWIVFLLLAIQAVEVLAGFTDVPRKSIEIDFLDKKKRKLASD